MVLSFVFVKELFSELFKNALGRRIGSLISCIFVPLEVEIFKNFFSDNDDFLLNSDCLSSLLELIFLSLLALLPKAPADNAPPLLPTGPVSAPGFIRRKASSTLSALFLSSGLNFTALPCTSFLRIPPENSPDSFSSSCPPDILADPLETAIELPFTFWTFVFIGTREAKRFISSISSAISSASKSKVFFKLI